MKITIESTTKIVELLNGSDAPLIKARVWEGTTESGIPVHVYITRIAASATGADLSQFEAELEECRTPSPAVAEIPLRLIL